MALLLDAALGVGMSELLKVVIAVAKRSAEFKANLETLKNTLETVKIIFDKIEERSRVLNRPQEETYEFINQLRRGVDVVNKCSTIPLWKRYTYSKKLVKLDKSIEKFFDIQVQGLVAVNTLSNGVGIQEINNKIDCIFECLNIRYRYVSPRISLNKQHQPPHIDNCASSSTCSLTGYSRWKGFPVLPDSVAGVDKPLQYLEEMAVRDKEPLTIISPVGTGISELLQDVACGLKQNMKFKCNLNTLTGTFESVKSRSNGIDKFNIVLNVSEEETYQFLLQINRGERYDKFDSTLDVQGLPESVVMLDEQLKDIKGMLLHDKEPVTVISAPEGSGKTTLAKKLCRDPEIQRIFGKNILFVTVSGPANITVIAEKILKWQLADFLNDDDAIKCLECFLKLLGPSPILLVLDDVWLNMESLMESLTFTLPDFKILVTSRFCSPRFSHVYNLKSVDDQHPITLFSQTALPEDRNSKITELLVEKSLYGDPEVVWSREEKKLSERYSLDRKDKGTHMHIRVGLPGVVIGEPSSLVIPFQASQCEATSTKGGKGKAKVVYEPEKKAYKPVGGNYYMDKDDFRRLLQELSAVFTPTPRPVQRPPTNGTSGASNQWNSQMRKGLPGVVIKEPSSQVIPSQAFHCEATSTKREKGKEKVV